jgi:hypothetical protein
VLYQLSYSHRRFHYSNFDDGNCGADLRNIRTRTCNFQIRKVKKLGSAVSALGRCWNLHRECYATDFDGAGVHSWPPNSPTNPHSRFSGRASTTPDALKSWPHPLHFPDAIFPSL